MQIESYPILDSKYKNTKSYKKCGFIGYCTTCIGNFCRFRSLKENNQIKDEINCYLKNKRKFFDVESDLWNTIQSCTNLNFKHNKLILEPYIPTIQPNSHKNRDVEIKSIKNVGNGMLNLTPKYMLSKNVLKSKKNFNIDLHNLLDFKNDIFLSLNTLDDQCLRMIDSPEETIRIFKVWNPDLIT